MEGMKLEPHNLDQEKPEEGERVLILHKGKSQSVEYRRGVYRCVCCDREKEEQPKAWFRVLGQEKGPSVCDSNS
jgi:hypothetical protein